jgi:hypothetical protein
MATNVKIRWRGAEFQRELAVEIERRMVLAEGFARRQYQENVATPYPPASLPGQFPHRRSGELQRGVRANVNRTATKVQLTLGNVARSKRGFPYPTALEAGTVKMQPRPHLLPTAEEVIGVIKQLLKVR